MERTNIDNHGSVLACWGRAALDALRAQGIDPQPLLAVAGFPDDAFRDPNARYPIAATLHLWRLAARRSGEPAFGIGITRHVGSTSLHALGYAILASATVGDALARAVRYSELIVKPGALRLDEQGELASLHITLCERHASLGVELRDALLSALVRMLRHASGGAFALRSAELNRAPRDLSPYRRFFACPITVGPADALHFERTLLATPLGSANAELARINERAVQAYLSDRMEAGVVSRTRAAISDRLSSIVSPELVASQLGLSLRSLQRALKAHDTSYEELLREVRLELACRRLREGRCSTSEIAFSLGYDSASAFSRAFRRWTGMAPSEYVRRPRP